MVQNDYDATDDDTEYYVWSIAESNFWYRWSMVFLFVWSFVVLDFARGRRWNVTQYTDT